MSSSGPPSSSAGAPAPAPGGGSKASSGGGAASAKAKGTSKKSSSKTATKAGGTAGTQAKTKKTTKRKKPANKASNAASNQAILNESRAAQLDLAKQRAAAAARKSDPLWYRMEDVLPAVPPDASPMAGPKTAILPEQAQIVEAALANNGLQRSDVTPQAMACLLEQVRRYAVELVTDAQDYAYAANRPEITRADLILAAELRADHSVAISYELPKLNLVATQVNRAPLPPIPTHCYNGVVLPPKEHQLTARTYDIVSGAQVQKKMIQAAPSAPNSNNNKKKPPPPPGYGASRGRQIPIKLKAAAAPPPAPAVGGGGGGADGAAAVPAPMDTSMHGAIK